MLSKLRTLWATLWLAVSTAPAWGPAAVVAGALHLAGYATAAFDERRASGEQEFHRAGATWSVSLPTERIPFVTYSLSLTLGVLWDPRYWQFGANPVFNDGLAFSGALGPLNASFYLSNLPRYEVTP